MQISGSPEQQQQHAPLSPNTCSPLRQRSMEKLVEEIEERLHAVVVGSTSQFDNSSSGIAGRLLELGELFRITESGEDI